MSDQPDEITQTFAISITYRPNAKDEAGNPIPPTLSFVPSASVGAPPNPDDCLALALEGAQWAIAQREGILQKLERKMLQAAAQQSRIIVPGREGMMS